MNEGTPIQPHDDDTLLSEEEKNKAKYIADNLDEAEGKTMEVLAKEYDEKRAAILEDPAYTGSPKTIMSGKEGAGTIVEGHKSSTHFEEGLEQ